MDECLRNTVFSSAHTAHVVYESNHIIGEVFRFSLLWPLVWASCWEARSCYLIFIVFYFSMAGRHRCLQKDQLAGGWRSQDVSQGWGVCEHYAWAVYTKTNTVWKRVQDFRCWAMFWKITDCKFRPKEFGSAYNFAVCIGFSPMALEPAYISMIPSLSFRMKDWIEKIKKKQSK